MRTKALLGAVLVATTLACTGATTGAAEPGAERAATTRVAQAAPDAERIAGLLAGPDPVTWVFTGDSITQGAMHTNGWRDYAQHFEERVRWEMKRYNDFTHNTAISGNRAGDLLADFDNRVRRLSPGVVSLMIGMNDATAGAAGRGAFRAEIVELVTRIRRETGAVPLLQTPNPVRGNEDPSRADLPAYAGIIREVAVEHGVVLVDHYRIWDDHGRAPVLYNDALHPNQTGQHEMAKHLFRALGIFDPASPVCRLTPA